ncbi:MAG: hypothetical protein ACYDBH_14850, partial [Acidobacteriaceae bacterium]
MSNMSGKPGEDGGLNRPKERSLLVLWMSGAWVLPLLGIVFLFHPGFLFAKVAISILAVLIAPLPALLYARGQRDRLIARAANAEEEAAKLKLQLDT